MKFGHIPTADDMSIAERLKKKYAANNFEPKYKNVTSLSLTLSAKCQETAELLTSV